jgi:hypothetical protein
VCARACVERHVDDERTVRGGHGGDVIDHVETGTLLGAMGSLIKKRRKRMRKKKHKKLLKRTRWQRRQQGR